MILSDLLQAYEDIALQSREILKTFVCWEPSLCPSPYKHRCINLLPWGAMPLISSEFSSRVGKFTNFALSSSLEKYSPTSFLKNLKKKKTI